MQRWLIVDRNKTLTALSVTGLVLLNLAAFNVATAVAAIALIVLVVLYFRGLRFQNFEIFIFILAELSPISLHASLPTALVYQALSVALLVALYVPLNHLNTIATHKRAALAIVLVVAIPPVLAASILYTGALRYSVNQVLALATLVFLAVVGITFIVLQHDRRAVDGAGS